MVLYKEKARACHCRCPVALPNRYFHGDFAMDLCIINYLADAF